MRFQQSSCVSELCDGVCVFVSMVQQVRWGLCGEQPRDGDGQVQALEPLDRGPARRNPALSHHRERHHPRRATLHDTVTHQMSSRPYPFCVSALLSRPLCVWLEERGRGVIILRSRAVCVTRRHLFYVVMRPVSL